ncbi:MAG: hypothetical protein WAS21_33225 [Geminicoccaceae bacterium]
MAIREWADARTESISGHRRLSGLLWRLTLLLAASVILLHTPLAVAQQVSLTVRNVTYQPVDLVWLDDAGAEEALGSVDSGQSVTLDAAVGWSFRALQGGQRIAEHTVTGAPGESWEVKASPNTATAEPAPHVQVDTGNPGNVPVELITIEPDGREASLGTLPPGGIGATLTTPGTALAYKRDGTVVATYVVAGTPGEKFVAPAPPAGPAAGEPTTFAAANPTNAPAELFWVRDDGTEVTMGMLAASSGMMMKTAVGHKFVYRRDGEVVATHAATGDANDRFEVPELPAPPAGQPTTLAVANPTIDLVDLFWVRGDGTEVPMTSMAPRAETILSTTVGHKFVYRRGGEVIASHTATGRAGDRFVAPGDLAPQLGAPAVMAAANLTAGPVELFWIRPDGGETRMRQLQPGEEFKDLGTKVGNRFVFRRDGQQIAEHSASGLPGDRFVAPHMLTIANYSSQPVELFQAGAGGREISRGQVAPGLRTAIAVTEGDIYLFKDNGQEIDRHVAADRPGNREFAIGERPPGNPQVAIAPGGTSGVLTPAVDQLLEDQKKQAFQTYFTRSGNVLLQQQLTDGQLANLTVRADAVTYLGDGGKRLYVRLATVDGSGLTLFQNGRPSATSGGSDRKWFIGKVTATVRPSNFAAFADTIWPRVENDYTSVSITDTTSWNATLSANAAGGAFPSVGGGPSFGIGGSSSKSVSSNVKDYPPVGADANGPVRYEWTACGISDKPKTTDSCSYRGPADIYDETSANLRTLKPISLIWPILATDTVFVVETPKAALPDWLTIDLDVAIRYDRVWLQAKNDDAMEFASGFALVFRPDQWGGDKSPAYLKHANQDVKSEGTVRSSRLTVALDIRDLKREMK